MGSAKLARRGPRAPPGLRLPPQPRVHARGSVAGQRSFPGLRLASQGEGGEDDEPRLPGALAVVHLALPRPLVDAMYVLLAQVVAGDTTLLPCPGCARPFRPRRRNHVWCTIKCADRTRQRRYYAQGAKDKKGRKRKKRKRR